MQPPRSNRSVAELVPAGRRTTERGAGLLSTAFGLLIFCAFLVLATHVMVNLWARSAVMHAATDAANYVATAREYDADPVGVQRRAIARANALLGAHSRRVELRFTPAGPDRVALHVQSAPAGILGHSPIGTLDQTIVVQRENR